MERQPLGLSDFKRKEEGHAMEGFSRRKQRTTGQRKFSNEGGFCWIVISKHAAMQIVGW